MVERITNKLAHETKAPATGNRVLFDDRLKGFGLRVTASGAKAFVFNYRNSDGVLRRLTIGPYGRDQWSVEAARKRAGELKKQVARGNDPMAEKIERREAPSVADLADRYIEEHLPKKRPSSQRDDNAMIAQIIKPKLGKRKVASVAYEDVDRLHRELKATPYRANRVLALLSKMFSLAILWHLRPDNPCRGVERFLEERREVELTGDQRAKLLTAMRGHAAKGRQERQTVNAIRLAMLTGCRIGEALSATWDQFDMERGVWTKPSAHTKQAKTHRVPLNAPALQLLAGLREASTVYLFPNGDGPQRGYKGSWQAIRTAAGLPTLRVHDLRHAFASEGAAVGLSLPLIGALLGHTNPSTTARYASLFDDPLRAATKKIGERFEDARDEGAA